MKTTHHKISFVTVCMNRKHHIMQTLPQNIANNCQYPDVEFVLLDYGSTDGLEQWVEQEMKQYIESGILIYYRTYAPDNFMRSHSRNMAFRLADGDLLCNVDADNFTGKDFAQYLNDVFTADQNIFVSVDSSGLIGRTGDIYGRFCCRKEDFVAVGGLDEDFIRYGWEDIDLYNRLKMYRLSEQFIDNPQFMQAITHLDLERYENDDFYKHFESYFIRQVSPIESEVICLYRNGTYERGTLMPSRETNTFYKTSIKEQTWITGKWEMQDGKILVLASETHKETFSYDSRRQILVVNKGNTCVHYFRLTVDEKITSAIYIHSTAFNYELTIRNKENKCTRANNNDWGIGTVFKNFNMATPIYQTAITCI
jgi:glycosyltransferase involved in cell wall biosynthesis